MISSVAIWLYFVVLLKSAFHFNKLASSLRCKGAAIRRLKRHICRTSKSDLSVTKVVTANVAVGSQYVVMLKSAFHFNKLASSLRCKGAAIKRLKRHICRTSKSDLSVTKVVSANVTIYSQFVALLNSAFKVQQSTALL